MSDRQKNRRADDLGSHDLSILLLASVKAAKNDQKKDMEHVLRLLYNDHEIATKIRSLLKDEKSLEKPKKIVPLRGLSYLFDNKLNKLQYQNTRILSKEHGANIFPAYNVIRETKNECRPPANCMELSDVSVTLPLQALLDHTAHRLLLLQKDVVETCKIVGSSSKIMTVKLQVKWGGDGSSDHSRYNQKYDDSGNSDGSLFATTIVPLRMTTVDSDEKIIWNNPTPQSPRWCRPIRLRFAKETDEFTAEELDSVQREVDALKPFVVTISGITITTSYVLYLTMIDGKVLAVKTNTKSKQNCCVCGATPKQFNNLLNKEIRFKPKEGSLNYGLSVLHLWIRSFEWLLHVSYRITFQKWQIRGPQLKAEAKDRKKLLQNRFLEKMFLRVDFPSTKGSGNTNNGNVCRKAFSDPGLLSEILELDKDLINRVRIILIALACQFPLDAELFDEFCSQTAEHYVKLYKWFPLPSSIHKVLMHSRDIMMANELPVGVLAEDAAESCNKLYRNNREFHARKNSRRNNLKDVFNRAIDSSDPFIASFGLQKRQNSRMRKSLPTEVLQLLKPPKVSNDIEEVLEEIDYDVADPGTPNDVLEEFSQNLDELNLPEDEFYSSDFENSEDEGYDD